jgi:probable F420-dependent oxidoreductase
MVAGQLALAEASEGRFLLGMGLSRPKIVEGMRGHTYTSPLARMTEYLEAMEAVAYQSPRPAHQPPHVLAAIGPKMLELAGSRSAGAHTYYVVPEHTAESRAALGPDPFLCPEQAVVLESDPDKARAIAREHAQFCLQFGSYRKALEERGFVAADFENGGSDRVIDAVVGWGDVDAVKARAQGHLDAGADHVAVQVLTAKDPPLLWRCGASWPLPCSPARSRPDPDRGCDSPCLREPGPAARQPRLRKALTATAEEASTMRSPQNCRTRG